MNVFKSCLSYKSVNAAQRIINKIIVMYRSDETRDLTTEQVNII